MNRITQADILNSQILQEQILKLSVSLFLCLNHEMAMFAKTQTKMMLNWLFHMTAKKQNNSI